MALISKAGVMLLGSDRPPCRLMKRPRHESWHGRGDVLGRDDPKRQVRKGLGGLRQFGGIDDGQAQCGRRAFAELGFEMQAAAGRFEDAGGDR